MKVCIVDKQVLDHVLHSKIEKGEFGLKSTSWVLIGNTLSKDITTIETDNIIYNYIPRLIYIGEVAEWSIATGC